MGLALRVILSGPQDVSAAEDGCMSAAGNSIGGEQVSDDVDYSNWVGSLPSEALVEPVSAINLAYIDGTGNSTTVAVPAGAFDREFILAYAPLAGPANPLPGGKRLAGHAFELPPYASQGEPAQAKPVTVRIQYSDQDVFGLNGGSLRLFY